MTFLPLHSESFLKKSREQATPEPRTPESRLLSVAKPVRSRFLSRFMSKGSIDILHQDKLSKETSIIIPGQLRLADVKGVLNALGQRPVLWLVEETDQLDPEIQSLVESTGSPGVAFSAHDASPEGVGRELRKQMTDGAVIVFLPGQVISRQGMVIHSPGRTLRFLSKLGFPIQPLATLHSDQATLQTSGASERASILCFEDLIPAEKASPATIREAIYRASETGFSSRSFLGGSLPFELIKGLKKHGSSHHLFDGTDDSELSFGKILAAALVLSKEIKAQTKKNRVGVILPPGKGGMVANLAVLFANKIPVNLNFTASHEAIHSSIEQADIDRFITADPFVRKVPNFPWPPTRDLIFIERLLPRLKKKIVRWFLLTKILPATMIAKIIGLDLTRRGDDEAVLLFTSGSAGAPKGVALSHRNILANVCQFGTPLGLNGQKILGSLPLFHSFGCTVTLWYPIIEGINLVTYPSPLETKRLGELVQQHEISLMISTPTFLRGFMRRVDPEQLASLRILITGAEKLPDSLARAFEKRFGILPLEGYGLTETSPVSTVNLPEPPSDGSLPVVPSKLHQSVGPLLTGMAIRITDPATDKPTTIDKTGIISLKGANIFNGYLNRDDLSEKVLKDGWFSTGDVGRMDDEGFLHIEGRISRFSKIAGEMVPHETVEAAVTKVLGLDHEEERKIVIVGVPDPKKGEALVLLSTVAGPHLEQENIDLRYKLLDAKIPSLWCPREILPIDEIPILSSGKLDIRGCAALADDLLKNQ